MVYRPLILLSIVIAALACCAQSDPYADQLSTISFRSTLTGTVRDYSGRPVNGARVDLVDTTSGRTVPGSFTFANGSFAIENLRHGTYEVIVTAGVAEERVHIDFSSDREVNVRLSMNPVNTGSTSTVSLSQMKVPGKAQRLLQKAEDAFRKARLDDAFRFVQKALVVYPEYAKALTLRGILHMQKGDNAEAQPDLEKAVQLDYGDDMSFIALAALYNNEGLFQRAEQTLEHGLSMNAQSWQASMEMARAQIGQSDYAAALKSLDRAIAAAPANVTIVHLFRAQALIGLKSYGDAIHELESYLEKSPDGPNSDKARTTLAQLKEVETASK